MQPSHGASRRERVTRRLRVMDTAACVFESTSVPAPVTPLPQGGEAKLFGEPAPSGTPFSDITHVKDGAGCLTGSNCLRTNDCKSGQCFANLTWVFDTPLLLGLSEGQFTQAYLEVFVRSTSAAPLSWCEVWLGVGSAPDRYRLSGFSLPSDGKYHKLQFPLRVLELQSKLLDYAVLAPGVRQVISPALRRRRAGSFGRTRRTYAGRCCRVAGRCGSRRRTRVVASARGPGGLPNRRRGDCRPPK